MTENIAKGWDTPAGSAPFGERLFEIAQQTPRHINIPDFGIPIGCASHDVWVLAYLRSWTLESDVDSPNPEHVLERGREPSKNHVGWKDGQLQDERCKVLAGEGEKLRGAKRRADKVPFAIIDQLHKQRQS